MHGEKRRSVRRARARLRPRPPRRQGLEPRLGASVIGSLIRVGAFAATRLPRRWTVEQPPANADRPTGQAAPGSEGAPRRTSLAAERTYLAWLRTGLGAIGVALTVGRLIPALIGGSRVVMVLVSV